MEIDRGAQTGHVVSEKQQESEGRVLFALCQDLR